MLKAVILQNFWPRELLLFLDRLITLHDSLNMLFREAGPRMNVLPPLEQFVVLLISRMLLAWFQYFELLRDRVGWVAVPELVELLAGL